MAPKNSSKQQNKSTKNSSKPAVETEKDITKPISKRLTKNSNKPLVEPEEPKLKMKKPKKTSTQCIQEDLEEDAKGSPEKLTRAAKILEIEGDAVAPPPIICSTTSTLPPRPVRDISSDIDDELNTEKAELNIQKSTKTISKAETGSKATSKSKAKTGSKAVSESKAKTDSSKNNSEEMDSENEEEDNDDDENLEETTPKKAKVIPPHSPSPIEVEGASRTHGGFSRGRAFGNTFNSADFDGTKDTFMHIEESDSGTVMGKVVIYSDHSKQSPPFVVSQPLGTKLGDILHNICVEYEYTAIQSCFIYIQDDDMWVLKGKYHKALEKNEVVPWVKDEKGKYIISVSAESITEMVPTLPLTLGGGTTSQLRQIFEPASYPFEPDSVQYKIASVFNVAKALCERNTKKDIQLSYQKYLAIHDIFAKFPGMIANNIWKERRPSNDDIIEVFMSKSTYYYYYSNPFSMVFEIPALEKWLKGDSDAPRAVEVWGPGVKPSLDSLKKLLNNIKVDHSSSENAESENEEGFHKRKSDKGKGKAKGKEKESGKGKGKGKGKALDIGNKGKDKEMEVKSKGKKKSNL
ncbi:hypothetical protein BDQ17DRAFT_1433513 [Cyathus striatus]|nr:hypothetical protein BDQ17DRAFT_1433513 [Cyathus striatus]